MEVEGGGVERKGARMEWEGFEAEKAVANESSLIRLPLIRPSLLWLSGRGGRGSKLREEGGLLQKRPSEPTGGRHLRSGQH